MLGVILIIDLLLLALTVYSVRGQRELLRESVLIGFVLWGSLIFVSTEIFSFFQALGFWQVLIFWGVVLAACLFMLNKHKAAVLIKELLSPSVDTPPGGPWPFLEQVCFNRIVFFSFCLGLTAFLAPPNTYDAMTYHMARVMHWIQDHSVTYYPTHIARQLYMPNFAEYIILHFQLLSGGDRWANCVQWLAMCGSLVGVSLIAKELGAAARGQILSALIAATIPMGILQATSTQTDYVETLWLSIFIYFFLRWRRLFTWGHALLAGAALGLAINTKGAALIIAVPFLLWMAMEAARPFNLKKFLMIAAVLGLTFMFYSDSFVRNTIFFHGNATKVLSADADSLINARFCWEGFVANVLRNTGLHVITPSLKVNTVIEQDIYKLAAYLHIDLNNKDWTYIGIPFSAIDFRGNENYLGNPLHLLLFGIVLVFFVIFFKRQNHDSVFYVISCFLGWVAFNLILKWQPWHARFHLPMFVVFAPVAGLMMERIKIRWIVSCAMGALFLSAWVIVFINVSKPIFSTVGIFYPQNRGFLHFMMTSSPYSMYLEDEGIAASLKKLGCKNIGLITGPDENEYLLWDVINPSSDPKIRIESVLVNNASASLKYPLGSFVPDAIIAINDDRPGVIWENQIYQVVWHQADTYRNVNVLLRNPQF